MGVSTAMGEPVFVIMAAGMGSRFGGLKQITPVDGAGNKLIDYSLYDARRAGFRKVVFIIKRQIEEDFKDAIGRRMEEFFDVRYVYQELDRLPSGFTVPEGRAKPWGTAHAIACAREDIDGPFAVLNADDYYGAHSIQIIYDFLKEPHAPNEHAMVGFRLRSTVTEHGTVCRGVCETENGFLRRIDERTCVEKRGEDAAYSEDGVTWTPVSGDAVVSMNLWGFQREILEQIEPRFAAFLTENLTKNPLKCEYYLPLLADAQIREGRGTIRVLPTTDVWHGMTYPEDLKDLTAALESMRAKGIYPETLWPPVV